jgi:hypothetical protein
MSFAVKSYLCRHCHYTSVHLTSSHHFQVYSSQLLSFLFLTTLIRHRTETWHKYLSLLQLPMYLFSCVFDNVSTLLYERKMAQSGVKWRLKWLREWPKPSSIARHCLKNVELYISCAIGHRLQCGLTVVIPTIYGHRQEWRQYNNTARLTCQILGNDQIGSMTIYSSLLYSENLATSLVDQGLVSRITSEHSCSPCLPYSSISLLLHLSFYLSYQLQWIKLEFVASIVDCGWEGKAC